jgi:rhodanese-related sulfurtransferase
MPGRISNDGALELCMNAMTCSELRASPEMLVLDVRRRKAYQEAADMIAGALRREPEGVGDWAKMLPRASSVVAYCVHGHEVSQGVAKALGESGIQASYLEGGIEGWKAQSGALDAKPAGAATRWVTRERPKIDRIACPWLISRFIDHDAEFLYVPKERVGDAAKQREAVPYDVAGVHFTHDGDLCSFDAFLKHYRLGGDAALARLVLIVRGADTGRPDLAPQVPGLLAVSQGLSRNFSNDHEMLEHGMVVYDALYAWCKEN